MHIRFMTTAATVALLIGLAGPIALATCDPALAGQSKAGIPKEKRSPQSPMAPDGPFINPNWPYNPPLCDQSGPLGCYDPRRDPTLEWRPGGAPGDVKKASPAECMSAGLPADCWAR